MEKKTPTQLNEAQERAAHAPAGPILIVAGAGTGKTSTLTSRILYLIEKGIPPERICAITFTNKAATEMAERVLGLKGFPLAERRSDNRSIHWNLPFARGKNIKKGVSLSRPGTKFCHIRRS